MEKLQQFSKDVLIRYIGKNTFQDTGSIIKELRFIEWQIKTKNALKKMNEFADAASQKLPPAEWHKKHRQWRTACQEFDAANEFYHNGKWRTEI